MTPAEYAMLLALQKAYEGDAVFRPSNADRWIPCPGSVQLIARLPRVPDKPGQAARQGTGAHKLGETVLAAPQGLTPEDFVGRHIVINDDPSDTIFVDEEMGEKITDYVALVDRYRAIPGTEIFVERKLTLQHLDPSDPILNECRGTGDVVAINRQERWIVVIDLKYGIHYPVPGNSPQPKTYLGMAFLEFFDGKPWNWGGTTIFQPRLPVPPYTEDDHCKTFVFQPSEIMGDFMGTVAEAMHAALGPNPKLVPSEKSCRWCEAGKADICPAYRDSSLRFARSNYHAAPKQTDFSDIMQPFPTVVMGTLEQPRPAPPNPSAVVLVPAIELDPVEISNVVYGGGLFETWYTSVKHRAAQLLAAGVRIPPTDRGSPGYHLEPRTGNRRWAQPREVIEQKLLGLKLKPTEIYTEPKLKSPKQVEDALPKLLKGAIEPLVERPPGQPTLIAGEAPQEQVVKSSLTMRLPS